MTRTTSILLALVAGLIAGIGWEATPGHPVLAAVQRLKPLYEQRFLEAML
jgi:hypothetical protein